MGFVLVVVFTLTRGAHRAAPVGKVAVASPTAAKPTRVPAAPSSSNTTPAVAASDRSEGAAEAAAVRFLELTEQVVRLSPQQGADVQRSIASDGAADGLAAKVAEALMSIRAQYPDGVTAHIGPVEVGAVRRGDGWDVAIWYVEVVVYGDQLALQEWRSATYSMVWEHDGWRMDALVSVAGPVPDRAASVVATPTSELIGSIASLQDWGPVS